MSWDLQEQQERHEIAMDKLRKEGEIRNFLDYYKPLRPEPKRYFSDKVEENKVSRVAAVATAHNSK